MKTIIRHATSADFQIMLDIDRASFPEGVAYDSDELSYFMNLAGAETIVLQEEDEIAAFLIMDIDRRRKTSTIITLDVGKEFRRRGYGTQLMLRSEEMLEARQVETYALQVDVENLSAIAFYERHGFKSSRVLKSYYSNGHDAYQMVKTLRPGGGG